MLTLIQGEKLIVRESCAEVTARVMAYRATLLAMVAERLERRQPGSAGLIGQEPAAPTGVSGSIAEIHRVAGLASLNADPGMMPGNSNPAAGPGNGTAAPGNSTAGPSIVPSRSSAALKPGLPGR